MALCGRNKYVLEFTTSGDYFPMRYDDSFNLDGSSTDNIGREAGFKFKSNIDQKVTYDLNDGGNPIIVDNIHGQLLGVVHYKDPLDLGNNMQGRFYQDGNSGDRVIKITFEQPLEITSFFIGYTRLKGDLPKNLGNFNNITGWKIYYLRDSGILNIPKEILNMAWLVSPVFIYAFNSNADFITKYPMEFLNSKIQTIAAESTRQGEYANINSVNAVNNNWDKFHLLTDSLTTINVRSSRILDGDLKQSIIDSWVMCENLKFLTIDTNKASSIYAGINQLVNLEYLSVGGGGTKEFSDWGDIGNLIKLKRFNASKSYNAPTTMPSYLLQMPELRKIELYWNYTTQDRWDEAIENLYNFVVDNAPIVNDDITNPVPMRNQEISMTAHAYSAIGITTEYIVQGTYQQPTGYVQGVSNGTPASQLEKIWVLANQYKVIVRYTDNR